MWNHRLGLDPEWGIDDYDLVYYDGSDLSQDGEAGAEKRAREVLPGVPLDVKNEARVHLWYRDRFGYDIGAYRSLAEAGTLEVLAPFGLADLFQGVVRANRVQITPAIYRAKTEKWLARWPSLTVLTWEMGT